VSIVGDALLGLNVGATNARAVLGSAGGQVVSWSIVRPVANNCPSFLAVIAELTDDLKVKRGDVSAVGVGLPGSTDERGPRWVPALPFLNGAPLGDDLGRRFRAPIRFANDAHCKLLAGSDREAARGMRNVVLDAVGTGIGGAPLADGRVVHGATGVAGAFGWLPASVPPNPRHGPWERAASGAALGQLAAEVGLSAEQLIDAVRRGDASAQIRLDRFTYASGSGIAALASGLDPEAVVMGGGLSEAFDVLEPVMLRAVRNWASPAGRAVGIVPAQLGADARFGALVPTGQPMEESG
jgi:predicted NBD/HSP70 family sugar kinase